MSDSLLHAAELARTRASGLQQDALALRGQSEQAQRRSEIAFIEIKLVRVIRTLERCSTTLESWNGQAPTEREMTQWIESIESALTDVEQRLLSVRGRG